MGESKGNISDAVDRGASLQIRKILAIFVCAGLVSLICGSLSRGEQSSKNGPNLIELARQEFVTLTEAEEKLFRAVVSAGVADYSSKEEKDNDPNQAKNWDSARAIDASRIAWLCKDNEASRLVAHSGMRVKGARIDGELDLEFVKVRFPMIFEKCYFTEIINLRYSAFAILSLQGTHTKSIKADGFHVERGIFLRNGFMAKGEVRLLQATVGGDLVLHPR